MLKVLSLLKGYRIPMGIAWFFMLTELAVELIAPLLMAKIIDEGILQGDLSVVLIWGGIMVGMALIAFLSGIINSFFAAHVGQSFGYDVRKKLYEKVQSFSFSNFNRFPTSSLITRMTNDVTQIQNTVFMSLRIMLRAPLIVIGGAIMALVVNLKLAIIFLITIPLIIGFLLWVMKKAGILFRIVQEKLDSVNNVMRENLMAMRLIKAFLRWNHEVSRFTKANQNLMDQTISSLRLIESTQPILLLIMNLGVLGILWFGNVEVAAGGAEVGEVVAIINYATKITTAISMFSFIIMAFSRAKASSLRIAEVFDTEIDLEDTEQMDVTNKVHYGKVEFRAVSFQYPGTGTEVLRNISFTVNPGESVAILGATGSGKTSLFQLIPRLYDVTQGRILIDDQEIQSIKLDFLRKEIGYVPQEALLFTGSVKENIAWGKEDATMDEIIEAAKHAQIHDTILKLPKQYETRIGQKGVNLSGGQKQRISIARALVRKPKILLLDDSTSALDLKTEARLLEALRQYSCTTFIITQKISTAMEADKILLLEDGELLIEGSHQTLLKQSPLYQKIYQSQFGEESLTNAQAIH
ncbi:MAG TPA: ABC transporter ATP-binding protein [Bacillus sp. (in: firmicutes)]|uniref:ABC transporter ATP-binding protein n=1 Tax=Bacillus litorisediminis TaxID=2922713 RepID=UPI001FAFDFEA|nr:ABC transporter ATP-binding protein [Bacillus litorisediminis]HWO74515.1 ABC transporter ATP-binding protein [Bacillus sp. (in: firmicutes)]